MQDQPKHPLSVKKSLTLALLTTLTTLSGVGVAQIIKANDELPSNGEIKASAGAASHSDSAQPASIELVKLSYDEVINLLSHDDYATRKKAHKYIWKQGLAIMPQLKQAATSEHPEIALRSADIIRNINVGLRHDTPKPIADRVKEFETASFDRKNQILKFLFQEKAYNQMVYMLAGMDNRNQANNLYKNFKKIPHLAAQEEISKGNVSNAIELLKMSPQTRSVRRSLAFLYNQTGLAKAELESLLEQLKRGQGDKEWLLMLLQELNDRERLREFAQQHNYDNTIAVLDLLDGNPKKLMSTMKLESDAIQDQGLRIINQIYEGKSVQSQAKNHGALLEKGLQYMPRQKFSPMHILYLTGGDKLGERILLESAPTKAMLLFDARERPVEALAAIGITDDASMIKWRDAIMARMLDKQPEERNWKRERHPNFVNNEKHLLDVVSLYWSRGAHDKAKLLMNPLLEALYRQDKDRWFNIIADFPRLGMHQLAMHYILKQANDDDVTKMVSILYDSTESTDLIWKTLTNQTDKNVQQHFQELSVLLGMYRGKIKEREAIETYLIKAAERQGQADLEKMHLALYRAADFRYDSSSTKKFLSLILRRNESPQVKQARLQELMTAASLNLDWKELTDTFKKHPNMGAESEEWLTIRSIAEREQGNEAEADALLDKAILMTVGLPDKIERVRTELAAAGDMKRANEILERLLLTQSESSQKFSFYLNVSMLADENGYYLISEQWKKASAMAYIANVMTISYIRDEIFAVSHLRNLMKMNFTLNFARGMYFSSEGEHQKAKNLLEAANDSLLGDGVLADFFYPALRKTPYKAEYNKWVKQSHRYLKSSITDFPHSANTRNTLAWILSRSVTSLGEGIQHSKKSLELYPEEPIYLDTMAELWFAKGDRNKAVQWGERAVSSCKTGQLVSHADQSSTKMRTMSLYRQLKRFKSDPLP